MSERARWRNWTGDRSCRPLALLEASELSEVVAAVQRAGEEDRPLRAVGSGHSYSDIAHSDGYMLSIDGMGRLLDADTGQRLVRVEAGITLGALNRELAALGLALPSLGEIDKQTLAGAIATDTHGGGLRFGSLSSQVASMQIVTADGSVVEIDAEDAEALAAASVGVGALGVVTAVTLRCDRAFTLRQSEYTEDLDHLLGRLDEMAAAHEHLNVLVFPYARRALVIERNRTSAPPAPRGAAATWTQEILLGNHLVGAVCRVAGGVPAAAPSLTRMLVRFARPAVTVDRSDRVFTNEVRFRVVSAEWGLPREAAAEAIEGVVRCFERERFPVALPVLCRFGAASDALLSPANGRETCYLEVLGHAAAPSEQMIESTEKLMAGLGGRPHWAKRFRATAPQLAPLYPGWERFAAVRARLDPGGRFANGWTERVLGPVAGGTPA